MDIELSQEEIAKNFSEASIDTTEESKGFEDVDIIEVAKEFGKENYSENFFKKEDGTILDRKEALKKIVSSFSKTQDDNDNDEFIANYKKFKGEGLSKEDYIQKIIDSNKIDNLPAKDYISNILKANKYTEDQVEQFLSNKTDIELDIMASSYKSKEKENLESQYKDTLDQRYVQIESDNKKQNVIIENTISKYFTENVKLGKHPLKFNDDEFEDIKKEAVNLMSFEINKKNNTNSQKINLILQDDDTLMELLPFIVLAKQKKLGKYLNDFKNSVKDREFEKINSTSNGLGAGSSASGKRDWSKFME
jgi:hypothetical protein